MTGKKNMFESAINYLKSTGVDFKVLSLYEEQNSNEEHDAIQWILKCHKEYIVESLSKPELHYHNTLFSVALTHLTFLAHDMKSFWDVLCDTIRPDSKKLQADADPETVKSVQKIIYEGWVAYCDSFATPPAILKKDYPARKRFLFAAYQYVVQPE
jgi:hypothetical protein